MFLSASGNIDQVTYSKMMEVKDYRDSIVHLEPYTRLKIQPKEARRMIKKAIECLEPLMERLVETEPIIKLPPKPKTEKDQ